MPDVPKGYALRVYLASKATEVYQDSIATTIIIIFIVCFALALAAST